MKLITKFTIHEAESVSETCGNLVPAGTMVTMRSKWPQFFPAILVGFHLRAEVGDPVIDEVINFLRKTGHEPNFKRNPGVLWGHPTHYQIEGERVWEQSDLDHASYFRWLADVQAGKGKKLPPDGTFEVEFSSYRGKQVGILENGWNPICSVEYRKALEDQHFKGLTFRPVQIKSKKPEKLELWQVWSSITLPPVLNEVTGTEGEPFDPKTSKACGINDLYFPYQYRFSAAKVAALEPFDIALTSERWGGGFAHAREPALIVSRRFRDWFMTQKIPVDWWPVALE